MRQDNTTIALRVRAGEGGKSIRSLRWKTAMRNARDPESQRRVRRRFLVIDFLRRLVALFVTAVPLNYLWELGQSTLYLPSSRLQDMWWHCFKASLGDGLLVGMIYAVCAILFREHDWYARIRASRYFTMLAMGLVVSVLVEWAALRTHRWAYAATMPLVPGMQIGLVPVVQMIVLPLMVFLIARTWTERRRIAC